MKPVPSRLQFGLHARLLARLLALLLLAGIGGCTRSGRVMLEQPFAPRSQKEIRLASGWMHGALVDGRYCAVLGFPHPGARTGDRVFVLYLSLPDAFGRLSANSADASAGRAFLIQERGRLSGKTVFSEGEIVVSKVPLKPTLRRVELDLRSADGTTLRGDAYVETSPFDVKAFETKYAADVRLTREKPSETTQEQAAETTSAGSAGPAGSH